MKTKTQLTLAWSLVVILAILLAIAGYFLSNPKTQENVSEKRDAIREHCSQTDQASRDACAQDLQDMSDILREFGTKNIPTASVKINP